MRSGGPRPVPGGPYGPTPEVSSPQRPSTTDFGPARDGRGGIAREAQESPVQGWADLDRAVLALHHERAEDAARTLRNVNPGCGGWPGDWDPGSARARGEGGRDGTELVAFGKRRPGGRGPAGRCDVGQQRVWGARSGLTSDEEDFVSTFAPAMSSSSTPLDLRSGLIKFRENRPVNHSGDLPWQRPFRRSHQSCRKRGCPAIGPGRPSAVTPATDRHRFRHRDAGGRSMDPILERAQFYLESDTSYAYRSLYRLILPSLYR